MRTITIWTAALLSAASVTAAPILTYQQTNLVSDIPGLAATTDPNLKNPWGISSSAASPFWVSDAGTSKATLYNSSGTPQALVVSMPGNAHPTGQVFNGTTAFNGDLFIFSTLEGGIVGWRGALGTSGENLVSILPGNAYTGLAISSIGANTYLYAANFATGKIDVYPNTGASPLAGDFTDPNQPAGYAPYNVQTFGDTLYVAYAKIDTSNGRAQRGAGLGFIDTYRLDGTFIARLINIGGDLNAPWGFAIAPATFGPAASALLVGNFGDGRINAYTTAGALIGTLADKNGNPLVNDGLWGLKFGNGGNGGSPDSLYFAAGINNEANGLFGRIDVVPEPATLSLVGIGLFAVLVRARMRSRR